MKKIFIIIISIIILSSCSFDGNKEGNQVDVQPNKPLPSESNKSSKLLIQEEELIYRNEIAGYQITFPENWRGYYAIGEFSDGEVYINFYGKSKTGQIGHNEDNIRTGLGLFQITTTTTSQMEGVIGKIGEVNGTEYYYAQWGGSPTGILYEIQDPERGVRELLPFEIDETELELAAKDWEKVTEMKEDIDTILKTFAPLK